MEYVLKDFYQELDEQPHNLLELLIKYASGPRVKSREEVKELREQFNSVRGFIPLLKTSHGCATCSSRRGIHIHHIIPLSCGGDNEATNLVPLCEKCHALVHPWLQADLSDIKKNIHGLLVEYSSAYKELNQEPFDPQYGRKIHRVRQDISAKIIDLFDY